MIIHYTVLSENLTGIKFDEIASKLHNKNMTDFKFDEMPSKKAHSIRKIKGVVRRYCLCRSRLRSCVIY